MAARRAAFTGLAYTVLIADDHDLTVRGTESTIRDMIEFEIVGTATNGIQAIADIRRLRPHFAVLDLSMPGATGLEVLIESRRWSPQTRIVIVTGYTAPKVFRQLADAGADGILLKNGPAQDLCDALRRIAAGSKVFSRDAEAAMSRLNVTQGLSTREIEVLRCVARGMSNAQIGEHLGVSAKTVDSHRTSLMRKMGVHSTATLLVKAMREGMIDV
ncbi:MAG: DNA-binding response regulator [Phyllobacteriaceae bacterium]|nr:DNA-binding response regulator [Phyllobacteriaceae bacterium]MBA91205.1 DNA-binding response regulator [Phyllobacteriaceae bacterium]